MRFANEPQPQPDQPRDRHLVLQSLDTAVSTWFTLLHSRPREACSIEEDQQPLSPDRTYLRRRHRVGGGDWGPWWEFVGQWREDGWIVDPVDVPTDQHPGRMFFVWDSESGRMSYTQLVDDS